MAERTGLVLEGGGARGAFQVGAFQALQEAGYRFDGISGTSIGAINGALIAQGDFELAQSWWSRVNTNLLFDSDDDRLERLLQMEFDSDTIAYLASAARGLIEKRGLDTSQIRRLLSIVINEEKLRSSPVDFGMVTVNLTDMKPVELFKEDIPTGRLVDYLMASSNLPVFRIEPLDGKHFIDGGFYDNCPMNMLAKRDYTNLVVIRTLAPGRSRKFDYPDISVTTILPAQPLGSILGFSPRYTHRNFKMGYRDAMRTIYGMKGSIFCINPIPENTLVDLILSKICDNFEETDARQQFFQHTLPSVARALGKNAHAPCGEIIYSMLENMALSRDLDPLEIYTPASLAEKILAAPHIFSKSEAKNIWGKPFFLDEIGKKICRMLI